MWRYGHLVRSKALLQYLSSNPTSEEQIRSAFEIDLYHGVSIIDLLELVSGSGWVINNDGNLEPSLEGEKIAQSSSPQEFLRIQINSLINVQNPLWASLSVQGREVLLTYIDSNTRQCFEESGLAGSDDDDTVLWWDQLANKYRHSNEESLTITGRQGERLSIDYEFNRTGTNPVWIAVNQSTAGYDILSQTSSDDTSPLLIEVKATQQNWESAKFFLSRNEWDVLSQNENNVLHLWAINQSPAQHAIVPISVLQSHIPQDSGHGSWRKLCCPYYCFEPNRV